MRHFRDHLKRTAGLIFAFPLVSSLLLTSCSTNEKKSPVEPPVEEEPADLGADSIQSAYLRDIRPRVVTYDGNLYETESGATTSLEEEFSTGEFLPRPEPF